MNKALTIFSDGNDGLIAYVEDTPIVIYGESMDEIMDSALKALDDYNLTSETPVSIGDISYSIPDDDDENSVITFP